MSKRIRAVLVSAICLLALGFASCGQGGGGGLAGLGRGGDSVTLRLQTIHGPLTVEFRLLQELAEELLVVSDGRLILEVNPLGTFASSIEGFTANMHGVFDINVGYGTWLRAIDNGLHIVTTGNMGMDPISKRVWLWEHGGFELAERLFARANLVLLAMWTDGTEVGHSRERFDNTVALQGQIFRTSDTRLMGRTGIPGITMPLEEIFTAFQVGAIDVVEYAHVYMNASIGLTDIARYMLWPDFWNVNNSLSITINQASYNRLPADLQQMLRMAFRSFEFRHWSATQFQSALMMQYLVGSGRNEVVRLNDSPERWAELRRIMVEIENEDIAQFGGMTEEALLSKREFMRVWLPYRNISRWWGDDLTPEQQMGF